MRKLLLAALLVASSAAQAETLWVAEARVIASTPACDGGPANVGSSFRAIYRPRGAPLGNGADSHLALFTQRNALWMRVPNNRFRPNVNYVGRFYDSDLDFVPAAGGILAWDESVAFGGEPASVNVEASFANAFGFDANCTLTFRMPFTRLLGG